MEAAAMLNLPWYISSCNSWPDCCSPTACPISSGDQRHFQTPFASPPGIGKSSPVVNVLWGFLNLAAASPFCSPSPQREASVAEWSLVGLGALVMAGLPSPAISAG